MIDHSTISLYISPNLGNSSLISFGGWDKKAIEDGAELELIQTKGIEDWSVQMYDLTIGAQSDSTINPLFVINPGVPYIYMS